MKLIYTHENRIMALNIRNVLINHGFDVALNNEFASSASGGLAPFDTWPEVWLLKDDDFDNAKKLIVILNGKIRDEYNFIVDGDKFKQASFREIKSR